MRSNSGIEPDFSVNLPFRSRLAVARRYHGLKLGGALLWDAIERATRSKVAAYALVVDAKDEAAESFYRHHGFVALCSAPGTLILPLSNTR
jgi:GNAT superfamily N-acetyltransferase